jgi:hypothetical protein
MLITHAEFIKEAVWLRRKPLYALKKEHRSLY